MSSLGTSTLERQGTGPPLVRRTLWLSVVLVVAVSAHLRWVLADLADWGLDEAATVWLAWLRLHGQSVPLGLVSSRDVPNMAGAPLLTLPFSLLSSPLSISRALSLSQLAVTLVLVRAVCRRGAPAATAVPVLTLVPALVLTGFSAWNQYYLTPLVTLQVALLMVWSDHGGTPVTRQWANVGYLAVAALMPAVHLSGFADLTASVLVYCAVRALRGPSRWPVAPVWAIAVVFVAAWFEFYLPWAAWLAARFGLMAFTLTMCVAVAGAAAIVAAIVGRAPRLVLRASESPGAATLFVALLCVCSAVAMVLPFFGAQIGRRLLLLSRPQGWILLVAQVLMIAALVPGVMRIRRDLRERAGLRRLLERHFTVPACAVLVIAHTTLALAFRVGLMPALLIGARPDLLVPLVPGLLAPLLLISPPGGRPSGLARISQRRRLSPEVWLAPGTAAAVVAFYWLAGVTLRGVPQTRYPLFVPGTEMAMAVDSLAAEQRADRTGAAVDVSYDLARGLEWVSHVCATGRTWFTVGRQYDWLLLTRHGLSNAHEGMCERSGPGRWEIGYRDSPSPPGMRVVERFEHLEIRRLASGQ
jgi:hypothetical protein